LQPHQHQQHSVPNRWFSFLGEPRHTDGGALHGYGAGD
jgi:hypothetical protein